MTTKELSAPPRATTTDADSFAAMQSEVDASDTTSTVEPVQPCPTPPTLMIRIALKDEACQALTAIPYRLTVDGQTWERETDSQGVVEQRVPEASTKGALEVWPDGDRNAEPLLYELGLAQMDPVALPEGQDARLHNLGFTGSEVETPEPADIEEAKFYFRWWSGLDEDHDPDEIEAMLDHVYRPETTFDPDDPLDLAPTADPHPEQQ